MIERLQAANSRPYGSISANTHLAFPDRPQTTAIRGMVRSSLTRQRPTLCKSRALYFGAASLPLDRSLSSRQGAVQSTGQPHLGGFESLALCQQKKTTRWVVFFCWQRMRDSNPRERSQSPVCYRYTNPLWAEQLYYTQFFGNVKGEFHFFRLSAARGATPRVIPGQVSQCPPPRPAPLWAGRRRFSGSPGWTPRRAPAPWTCRSPCRRSRPYPSGRPPSPHRRSGS